MKNIKSFAFLAVFLFSTLASTSAYAVNACNDAMTVPQGSGHGVSGNTTGSISGTPWGFEQWYQGGSASMTYYDNGTFKANWNNSNDYLTRVGYQYGGGGIDHKSKYFTVDYNYKKTGSAQYGYIGVYGWTANPETEYYIVDDWYSKPSENDVGEKFGEIEVDGAKYTIHAFLRQQEPSKSGTSTFVQFFSVRQSPRQCGHIDISAHFKKWDELFTGQNKQLKGSKGGGSASLKFGKVTEVMLMTKAGGGATGSVEYTYFDMTDNGSPSEVIPPKEIERKPFGGTAVTIPGTVEAENFDEGNEGVSYSGAQGASGDDGDHDYRGEDYSSVDIVSGGTGKAIGYTAADEWLEYTVNVAEDGLYDIEANVSNGLGSGTLELSLDGESLASLAFTGVEDDWEIYELATGKAMLTKGEHVLRITIANDNTNVDYVKFTLNPRNSLWKAGQVVKGTLIDGSQTGPYQISTAEGLDLLASEVSSGNDFENTYFEVTDDISYDVTKLDDGNNFTPIGNADHQFKGKFNGNNKTISGIRINKPNAWYQGLFGYLGKGAVVEKVTLADAEITTGGYTGGIVGLNKGTVSGCTSSATITSSGENNSRFGGIVGYNEGTVSGCTSSATVTSSSENSFEFGGIAGYNAGPASSNLAKNVTVSAANYYGAVFGNLDIDFELSNNYYTSCTVGGEKNATDAGVGKEDNNTYDFTEGNGAVSIHTVTLGEGVSISSPEKPAYIDKDQNKYYAAGSTITFSYTPQGGKVFSYVVNGSKIPYDKFPMPAENLNVSVDFSDCWGVAGGADGSEDNPYIISTVNDMNTLALFINSGYDYNGKYFKLSADIKYPYTSTTENNYTAIGTLKFPFKGNFNGNNHTISGIRISKPGDEDYNQGLFGVLGDGAVVENVTLADVEIKASSNTGGIAGLNDHGSISNCTVENNVKIAYLGGDNDNFGGIVGYNRGIVSDNISSATLTSSAEKADSFGGIVGVNENGSVSNNLAKNVTLTVSATTTCYGAVVGSVYGDESKLSNNVYIASTVAGVKNATNVGVGRDWVGDEPASHDVTKDNGAVSVSVKAPTAVKKLVYDGSSQNLVTAGETNYGTMYYSLDGKSYSAEIPAASGAKTYTVYYKVMKEDKWTVFDAQTLEVSIAKSNVSVKAPVAKEKLVYSGKAQELVTAGKADFGTLLYSLDGKDYSAEIPAAAGASAYTLYYKVAGSDNWNGVEAKTVEISIAQAPLTITAKDKSIVYGDEPANDGVEYSGFIGDETASVLGGKLTYSYNYKKLDKAGKYAITPSGLTASNYEITFIPGTLNVAKVDVSVKAPSAKEKLVYSGKAQELVTAGTTDYGTLLYSLDNKDYSEKIPTATDAKTYTVYYKVAEGDNWNAFDAKTVEVKISKIDVSVKAPSAKEKLVYSGKAQELVTAGTTDFGTLLYSLDGKKFSEKIPTATDAKTYTVYYKVAEGDNWNAFAAKKVEVKIAEKHTSAIRRVDARTDKYKMQRNYDLKGRKVQGTAKAPGAYYGKKVLNK